MKLFIEVGAIVEKSQKYEIIAEKCDGCGACVEICPAEVIVEG